MAKKTPEGVVKDAVKEVIKTTPNTYSFWPVQTGRGKTTLDCLGARSDGRAFAVETKEPNKADKLTAQQKDTAREMLDAKVAVFIINETDGDDILRFRAWLDPNNTDAVRSEIELYNYARVRTVVGFE